VRIVAVETSPSPPQSTKQSTPNLEEHNQQQHTPQKLQLSWTLDSNKATGVTES
jgi:hypothetical protein